MKKKALVASILTIALCLSLIAGSTFALFTSESTVNIAVTSGKVEVVAKIDESTIYSPKAIAADGSITDDQNTAADGHFGNGGTAVITDNAITLTNMTPGDKVEAFILVENKSNVSIKYRTVIKSVAGDVSLLPALKVTFGEGDDADTFVGNAIKSSWTPYEGTDSQRIKVTIELPGNVGNDYQEKSCTLQFIVEAVQGNADMPDEWDGNSVGTVPTAVDGVRTINSAAELAAVMAATTTGNSNSLYDGETIKLACDIDFGGHTISGIGGHNDNITFTFDGNGHTISNFVINGIDDAHKEINEDGETEYRYAGLFQQFNGTIKNLTVRNATIIGNQMVGVIASNVDNGGKIENCKVYDSTVIGAKKVGAVAGYIAGSGCEISSCYAENCNVYASDTRSEQSAAIVGYTGAGATVNNADPVNVNVYRGVTATLVSTAVELADLKNLAASVDTVILAKDIDMTGVAYDAWTLTLGAGKTFTLDGNGHTISNLTVNGYVNGADFQSAGLFARVESASHTPATNIGTLKVQNLTLANANVAQNNGSQAAAAALVGCASVANVDIDDCKVINSTITSAKYAGAFIGYAQQYYTEVETTIDNSVVEGCTITANGHAAGMVGYSNEKVDITGGSVKNNTVDGQDGHSAAALVGTGKLNASGVTVSGNTYRGGGKCGDAVDVSDSVYGISHRYDPYTIN